MAKTTIAPLAVAAPAQPAMAAGGTIQTVPWHTLKLFALNPRKRINTEEIVELAESVFGQGILQNLIGRPAETRPGGPNYPDLREVVAGQRRYYAVKHLVDTGRVGADYPMPMRILPMTDREALRLAITENVQRRDMTPLEEADGFAQMMELGDTLDTICAATCYPSKRVQQRLVLHHRLSPAVRQALDEGAINLGQAQAFTLGEKDRQEELLPTVTRAPKHYDGAELRRLFTEKLVPMSRAIFPRNRYKAAAPRDLFGAEEEYAEDRAEFARLQREAAEAKRAELAAVWAWTEVQHGGFLQLWNFERDDAPTKGGAIVHVRDDLRVEIHTGLVRPAPAPAASPASRPAGATSPPPSAIANAPAGGKQQAEDNPARPFTKAHLIWARQEKTRRLQMAVTAHHAVAMSLVILGLIGSQEVRIRTGAAWSVSPDDRIENKPLRDLIDAAMKRLNGDTTPTEATLFRRVLTMPVAERQQLFNLLVDQQVGTWPGNEPELGDTTLATAIAEAVDAVEPDVFQVSTPYLERLGKAQLVRVARECGIELAASLSRDEMIDAIALGDRDPAWRPPELYFGPRPAIMRRLGYEIAGGGRVIAKQTAA